MSRRALLAKPHWQRFLDRPGLGDLPMPALLAADHFFAFARKHALPDPQAQDISRWAATSGAEERAALLEHLSTAMAVCIPCFVARVEEARRLATPAVAARSNHPGVQSRVRHRRPAWDPIAPPSRTPPRPRRFSVQPWELPEPMQAALRQMAENVPRNGVAVCKSIVMRMREKLCQFVWSARGAGLPPTFSDAAIERYVTDVMARSEAGKNGLRWATVRAAVEELHRYARYTGEAAEVREGLARRLAQLEGRERRQKALKFFELGRTGNTTTRVLDRADVLLERAAAADCPKRRHRLRNGACILGLYPVAPLRPASADLVFGETLFWRKNAWVIDTWIQKTHTRRPEPFVMRLRPEHGMFIDAVLLGDHHPRYLPELRNEAIASKRQLFVLPDGSPTAETYVPRVYKVLTGNSFATTRTMLHTDLATLLGMAGRVMAMLACHQTSEEVAERYEGEAVAHMAINRRQTAASARRARYDQEAWQDTF